MTAKTVQSNWGSRYAAEVEKSVIHYEMLNAHSDTIIRKATDEENEYYLKVLEKAKKEREAYDKERKRYYTYGKVN